MSSFALLPLVATLLAESPAGSRRNLELDDCARHTSTCERACDGRRGPDRLSCRTECRQQESECRHRRRTAPAQ